MEEIQTIVFAQTFEKGKEVMKVVDIITETIQPPTDEPIDKEQALKRLEALGKEIEQLKAVIDAG